LLIHSKTAAPVLIPIEIVQTPSELQAKTAEIAPAPQPQLKAQKLTPPKLLSKPTIFEAPLSSTAGNLKPDLKPEEPLPETMPQLASLPESPGAAKAGWNVGNKSNEAEGSAAGSGNLFGRGDVGVVAGSGMEGGGEGRGTSGLGRASKGDGTGGGGVASTDALAGLARPLGGYQVKPRYPDSARKAGVQGTTLLKLQVLANGKVGEVLIEKSAGHRDLDSAAAEAVKKWLFEPARMGKEAVAVWVLLPVKFELQ
jgi:protein TonB